VVSACGFGPVQRSGYFCAGLSIARAFEAPLVECFRSDTQRMWNRYPISGIIFRKYIASVWRAGDWPARCARVMHRFERIDANVKEEPELALGKLPIASMEWGR
jgi:hypothetical protein